MIYCSRVNEQTCGSKTCENVWMDLGLVHTFKHCFHQGLQLQSLWGTFMDRHFNMSALRFWLALLCMQLLILELNHTAWWKHAYMVFLEPSFQIICKVLSRTCQLRRQQYKPNSKATHSASTAKEKQSWCTWWWKLLHTTHRYYIQRVSFQWP